MLVRTAIAALAVALACTAPVGAIDPRPADIKPAAEKPADKPVPFLAHRAVYELTLGTTKGEKAPSAASGLIAYEFTGSACSGYVTNFRQMTQLEPSDGATRISDMRSTTYEDGEGKDFRFKIESKVDDVKQDELDGHATRGNNGALKIALARPKPGKFEFTPGIVFPTEHLERVLATARAGGHALEVKAFDGSETGSKIYDTFTTIGKAIDAPADEAAARSPALRSVRRWPVEISYFDQSNTDGIPAYQLSFDLFENGVSRALKLDYGNFVLNGKLSRFETLPVQTCNK